MTATEGTAYTSHRWPQFLPDGRHFLYLGVQQEEGRDQSAVFLGSIGGREPQLVLRSRSQATYANGYLLFIRDRTLWAQPFDVEREALGGAPVAVARDVLEDPTIWRGIFSVSDTGTLVYEGGVAGTSLTLYDRAGHEVGPVGERGIIFDVNVSPDGSRVAVNRGDPADIWVYELGRGTSLRLTFDVRNETMPVWSPDGQQLAFNQVQREAKNAVLGIPAAAARAGADPVGRPPDHGLVEQRARDAAAAGRADDEPGRHLGAAAGGPPRALLQTPFAEYHARFSPDMRWVSYVSNESGRDEVYVMPFVMPARRRTAPAPPAIAFACRRQAACCRAGEATAGSCITCLRTCR